MRRKLSKASISGFAGIMAWPIFAISGCSGDSGPVDAALPISLGASPAAPDSLAPHLAATPGGDAVLSWLEPAGGDAHAVRYSVLRQDEWSSPVSVAKGNNWFVNYADIPSVVPITEDVWAAHWLSKQPGGTYAYDIAVSISPDGGQSWSPPFAPHDDGTPTEHGFVTLFPWSDSLGAVWLDGRNTQPDATSSASPMPGKDESPTAEDEAGGMTLRYARFDYEGKELDGGEIDDRVCDCCQTDVAMTDDGPLIAYRDRSTNEIRDISVVRHAEGRWTEPVTISDDSWQIAACPVNGPAIAASGANVVVTWYAAPDSESRIKLAWSRDAGRTFTAPVVIDEGGVNGRVDVTLIDAETAVISWVGKTDSGIAQVRMREAGIGGEAGPVKIVAEGNFSRGTGFPKLINTGSRLVIAWPEAGDTRRVHTGIVAVEE